MDIDNNNLIESDQDEKLAIELSKETVSNELKMFKKIEDLNWAWVYEEAFNTWKQFECINCMILESKFWLWKQD